MKQITLLFFVLFSISISGQKIIKGTITDGQMSLPYATVSIKNTAIGVVADENGRFSIKAKRGDELFVSYLGFKPKTILVQKNKDIKIDLVSDNYLDEVVVVGYQIQSRKHLTNCGGVRGFYCEGGFCEKNKHEKIKQTNINRLYPNPSLNGVFRFKLNPDYDNVTISVTNLAGQNINRSTFRKINNVFIDLSDLPSGMYIFTINNNGKRVETLKGIKS